MATRQMIDAGHRRISIRRQCELLGLNRSTYYWEPAKETADNLQIMRQIDELYTEHPFYGSRRMAIELGLKGVRANRKRVQRLMGLMGLEAIYPKPNLSKANQGHIKYPYLLRGLLIDQPNQVWAADITYVPMYDGFMYLVAVIDWLSRYVLSWELSNTLDAGFCIEAVGRALANYDRPTIFNTDQGVQFTCEAFVSQLLAAGIQVSMDGKGRALDNVYIERLWRSVKYEEIYPKEHKTVKALRSGLQGYFDYYNNRRPHQGLEYCTPLAIYSAASHSRSAPPMPPRGHGPLRG